MTSNPKDGGVLVLSGGWRRVAAEAIPWVIYGVAMLVLPAHYAGVLVLGKGFLRISTPLDAPMFLGLSLVLVCSFMAVSVLLRLVRQLGADAWCRTFVVSEDGLQVWEADGSNRLLYWSDLHSVDPKTGALIFLDGSEVLFRRFTLGVFADFFPAVRERILKVVSDDCMYAKAVREYRGVRPTIAETLAVALALLTMFPLTWLHATGEMGESVLYLYGFSAIVLFAVFHMRKGKRMERVRQKWLAGG